MTEVNRLEKFIENPLNTQALTKLMESREILQQFVDIGRKAKNGGNIRPTEINQYGS